MSKEKDNIIINNLAKKMMPLSLANAICEANAIEEEERYFRDKNRKPYKQKRNKDKAITEKRKALKQAKKRNRK